jgi:hypothetical protein
MTEDAWRTLKTFSRNADLAEGEALSFLFENFNSVTHHDNLLHRLKLFSAELEEHKK